MKRYCGNNAKDMQLGKNLQTSYSKSKQKLEARKKGRWTFRVMIINTNKSVGSGCGTVGRAVTSDTRIPGFESSYQQLFKEHLSFVICQEKTKI